ncbi:MAG: ATP-binding protein [Clostridia bacterium]|nr:ATP-binding protein [Clostridia bacterium]
MSKFIMMIGIPGSGKSTFAEKIAQSENGIIISSDELREELFGNVWEFKKNALLFSEMFRRSGRYLNEGKSVVFDATNITRSERKQVLKKFEPFYKVCYYIKTPLEKVLYQNSIRNRNVPEEIIIKMHEKIQEPDPSEGWDEIHIIDNS